jgi:hypothetical protein
MEYEKIIKLNNVTPINIAINTDESINQLAVPVLKGNLMVGTQAHLNIDIDDPVFDNVDFIKVDTEGFDSMVLSSGKETIIKYKPIMKIEEDCLNGKYDWLFD